ncbi:MAG: cytochrome c biogenesis protein CcsA [Thermoanaerobaculia bacterium]|nr:cytochrome c biogenesis protein CcsA [Thermoanaerobaculia bacterium]
MSSNILAWAAVALYAAAEALSIRSLLRPRSRTGVPVLLAAGLVLHFIGLYLRARAIGSVPYRTLSGSLLLFGWMLALACLILLVRHGERAIGPFLIPFVLLVSAAGLLLPTSVSPATPETRGTLFALHVTLGILAYAAFTLSFVLSLLYLIQNRQIRRARTGLLFARLPALDVIGRMNRTSVSIGLGALGVSVLLGALWAQRVWHSLADPKLAWAIVTLLLYGLLLWMDRRGWEGRRVALLSMLGFGVMIFSYTFVNLYTSTEHVFR